MLRRMTISLALLLVLGTLANGCKAKFRSVNDGSKSGGGGASDDQTGDDSTEDNANGNNSNNENVADEALKIDFTANGSPGILTIKAGTAVELEWSSEGYSECEIASVNQTGASGKHSLGNVSTGQTHKIVCQGPEGEGEKTVEIRMEVAPQGPTADLKVNNDNGPVTLAYDSTVHLTWSSSNATICSVNPGSFSGTSGSQTVTHVIASVVYVLSCTGPDGTTMDSVTVNIDSPTAPTANFTINGLKGPIYVDSGANLNLVWSSQQATACTLAPLNLTPTPTTGQHTVTNFTTSTTYTLHCEGPGGQVTIEIPVYVNQQVVGTLDLKVNGQDGPVNIAFGAKISLAWTSTNASQCEVVTPFKKYTGLQGVQDVENVTLSQSILMICSYNGGIPQYDYVTVIVDDAPNPVADLKINGKDDVLVVNKGDSIVMAWTSQNAASCTVNPGNFSGTQGVQTIQNMQQTATFVLLCSGAGGTYVDAVVVHVNTGSVPTTKLPVADLKVNGSDGPIEVAKGSTVQVSWSSQDATECTVTPTNSVGISGTKSVSSINSQTIFVLVCVGPGGSSVDMVTVRTTQINTDPNAPKPTADLKINGSDGPLKAFKGDPLAVTWWSTNATDCVLNPGFFSGTHGMEAIPFIQQTTIYVLTCVGPGGHFVDQVTVNVDVGNMAPIVDLKANNSDGPLSITLGETVQLVWNAQYAEQCTLSPQNLSGVTGSVNAGAPQQTIIYSVYCKGIGGTSIDTILVNVHKPTAVKLSCRIYIDRSVRYGCGPNGYEAWWLWLKDPPPSLVNGQPPSAAIKATSIAHGAYGNKRQSPFCPSNTTPLPVNYTHLGYTYKLWTNQSAGSNECQVYTRTASPLVISFTTDRLNATAPNDGPLFDLSGEGTPAHFSWPSDGAKHMFLVYDKNGNSRIESVHELFGDRTTGPDGQTALNGFEALRKYDANRDGRIDATDPIYQLLQLWGDRNGNGVTDVGELIKLNQKGVRAIQLKYQVGQYNLDFYGNEIKETSTVDMSSGRSFPIVDVWFVGGNAE